MRDMSAGTLLTFAQFEALPEKPGKQELLHGRVIEMPPARTDHQQIAKRILFALSKGLPLSRIWIDTGYRVGHGWLIPDVSVSWPDQDIENGYLLRAPSIAVEVVSPSNTAAELQEKVEAYLAESGGEAWVIYPSTLVMLVHTKTAVRRFDGIYETPLVPGFTRSLPDLFL